MSTFKWKFVLLFLQLCTIVLAIAAMVTDYWGVIPSSSVHFGLFRYCNIHKQCDSIPVTGDIIALLIVMFLMSIVISLPCSIVDLRLGLGCLSCQSGVSFLIALLGFAAMIHSTVVFSSLFAEYSYYYSWSFALGWLSVVIAVISGGLSIYACRRDPESLNLSSQAIKDKVTISVQGPVPPPATSSVPAAVTVNI